ncbi:hypothetical protein HanPSC8_Chr05g0199781 [Helianthus annuus]|uniref:Uncharacterized protein n=1 Tax=Helianthus annuus TaxID=4232 RepID=A0A251RUL9_HELAN|nr:hypothetical protein HanPSC8_Chr05g0199781 [Helianthus annuus]
MATALASEIDEIWPPDMAKSSAVEERSLTAHRISEDNLVSESDARDISNKTGHGEKQGPRSSMNPSKFSYPGLQR